MGTCSTDFSDQFRIVIIRHKRIGYDLNAMQQSACLVINSITDDSFAALFSCRLYDCPDLNLLILVGWDRSFRLLLGPPGLNLWSSFASYFQWCCLAD